VWGLVDGWFVAGMVKMGDLFGVLFLSIVVIIWVFLFFAFDHSVPCILENLISAKMVQRFQLVHCDFPDIYLLRRHQDLVVLPRVPTILAFM